MSSPDTNSTSLAAIPGTVVVNGERHTTAAMTLAELLAELGHGEAKVATAINGDFVPERKRASTVIHTDDRIEVVSPRQGG